MSRITPTSGNDVCASSNFTLSSKYKTNTSLVPNHGTLADGESTVSSPKSETQNFEEEKKLRYMCSSIKCLLMLLISLLVLISVVVLSIIWISTFSSAISEMSSRVRAQEFDKIMAFTKKTVNDVLLVTESVKSQLHHDFDFNSMIEHNMFRAMKVAQTHLPNVTQGVYIGDPFGGYFGLAKLSGEITYYNLTPNHDQVYFICRNFEFSEFCDRNQEPDFVFSPYSSNYVAEMASTNPGNPVFTLSYVDPSLPEYVFLTMVSSLLNGHIKEGAVFSYYFAYDMTVMTVSTFLLDITSSIHGSSSFIVETQSEFVIASDQPGVSVATVDDDGNVERKTTATFGGKVSDVGRIIYDSFKTLDSVPCNEERVLSLTEQVISVNRLCSKEGIDWVVVLSVPQWNYYGPMIIAIISAIFGSVIIVSIGIIVAILFSLKIVRPFTNLINAFEMVSNMELDNLNLYKSIFTEVKILQFHFKAMIDKIKMYRKFIPPHLLRQLDANQGEQNVVLKDFTPMMTKNNSKRLFQKDSCSNEGYTSSYFGLRSNRNSTVISSVNHTNMFSLYLDRRRVTFVNTYMEGLNEWFVVFNPNEIVELLSEIYEIIVKLAKVSNGQVGKIEDESIPIHFNATNDQSQHEMRGIQLCHSLLSRLNSYKETRLANNCLFSNYESYILEQFQFRIVANSQNNYCGNLGTKQAMSFSIVGSAQHNLKKMVLLSKDLDVPILITEDLYEMVENKFQVRYVDTLQLLNDQHFSDPSFASQTLSNSVKVFELGEINTVTQDEWMYELEAKEKKNRWKKYNEACFLYFASRFTEACSLLEEYLVDLNGVQDLVAIKLLEKCRAKDVGSLVE